MQRPNITKRRLVRIAVLLLVVVVGWFAVSIVRTIREIPEAYAAWDTGTLLTTYMDQNDGRWPTNWDDLATAIGDGQPRLYLHADEDGNPISNTEYIGKLRSMILVDWTYDPVPNNTTSPVTRIDGGNFRTVWSGAEPNAMVRSFIIHHVKNQENDG